MSKYESYKQLEKEITFLREDCENFRLRIGGNSELCNTVNMYLETNRLEILSICCKEILKKRDRLLIEAKEELTNMLSHIEDIQDVSNNADSEK